MMVFAKVAAFQVLWYICVYLGSINGLWSHFLAFILSLIAVVLDFMIFRYQLPRKAYALFALGLVIFGLGFDYLFVILGLLRWNSELFYPYAISGVWLMFIVYYPRIFQYLANRLFLAALLAFIFGPLAYYTGAQIGAMEFNWSKAPVGLFFFALGWAVFFPSSIILFNRIIASSKSL